jgi:RNA polymerase sigma-70 factor (ECF subfamily)
MALIEGSVLALAGMTSARDEVDLAALVETYAGLLFRVAHSVVRNRAEAEDVVQDVFVRVVERKHKLGEIREIRVWLVRIAWNLALDRRRRIRPEQFDVGFAESLVGSDIAADKVLDEAQRMASVLRELERLPKGERHVLLLAAIEELGTAEIAEVLGRSESAVRALLFRARTRLRERLEGSRPRPGMGSCPQEGGRR